MNNGKTNIQTIWVIFILFISCNKITSGDNLTKSDIQKIKELGILNDDERIIKFYSEYKNNVAGNFYTDKRVASYWQDENHKTKNEINSAFYEDVLRMDTVAYAGVTYSPYLNVIRKDSTTFKVHFDGEKTEIQKIFKEVISIWKSCNR